MSRLSRHRRLVTVSAVAVLVTAGAAFAYWTTTGSGTGSSAAGHVDAVSIIQVGTLTAMYPGDSAQTLHGTIENPNPGPVHIGTITASISSVVKAPGAPAGTCAASDFTLANAVATVNAEALADDTTTWTGPTIKFNDKVTSQDACKDATVNLAYTVG